MSQIGAQPPLTVQPGNTPNTVPWLIKPYTYSTSPTVLNGNGQTVVLDLAGNSSAAITVTAISSPNNITLVGDVSYDGGTNWILGYCQFVSQSGGRANTLSPIAAGNSNSITVAAGVTHVRVRVITYTSGSYTVVLSATNAENYSPAFTTINGGTTAPLVVQIGGQEGANARAIQTDSSGNLKLASLPAGTAAIGKLAANDGVDIGDVTINNTSIAVTGTFWQATQPVSLSSLPSLAAGTAAIGKLVANDGVDIGDVTINNASIAVTGTFWQATQPVSLASLPALAAGTATIGNVGLVAGTAAIGKLVANDGVDIGDVTINNASIAVTGTFWQATQPVSLSSLPALAYGTSYIGSVGLTPKGNVLDNATTTALSAALTVKTTDTTVFRLVGYSSATYEQFIHMYNVSSAPTAGAVPTITFIVPPRSNFSFDFGVYGRRFINGLYIRNSSTASTLTTAGTASDCWFDVMYA
jgi:hypothetical protein